MSDSPAYCRPIAYETFAAALMLPEESERLELAAVGIAQHENPDEDHRSVHETIARLGDAVRQRVQSDDPQARLAHLHDVLFDVVGFTGNKDDYYSADNSYLPTVLRTRSGLPITLTLVYRLAAQQVGISVQGINAPGHFLAQVSLADDQFYVDPFFGGSLLSESEALDRISTVLGRTVEQGEEVLQVASTEAWLLRMLANLQGLFAHQGRDRDLYAMQELQELVTKRLARQ